MVVWRSGRRVRPRLKSGSVNGLPNGGLEARKGGLGVGRVSGSEHGERPVRAMSDFAPSLEAHSFLGQSSVDCACCSRNPEALRMQDV